MRCAHTAMGRAIAYARPLPPYGKLSFLFHSLEFISFVHAHRVAPNQLRMLSPGRILLVLRCFGLALCKYCIQLFHCDASVLQLAAFFCRCHSDTGRYMDQADAGFDFVYILTAFAAAMKPFEADVAFFA